MKIKPAFFNIIAPIAHRIPLEPLIRSSGIRLFLPFYHAVADEAPPHIKHLYRTRTVEEFRSDLAYMLRFYTPISLQTLLYHTLEGVPFESVRRTFSTAHCRGRIEAARRRTPP